MRRRNGGDGAAAEKEPALFTFACLPPLSLFHVKLLLYMFGISYPNLAASCLSLVYFAGKKNSASDPLTCVFPNHLKNFLAGSKSEPT